MMDSEDGELFIKQLATFVRTHEKALANALQFKRQNAPRHGSSQSVSSVSPIALAPSTTVPERPSTSASTSTGLAAAFSLGTLSFTSQTIKSAKLALTPHHLFYLLSRFDELGIPVGPMKVRLENLHDTTTSANYVSFLGQSQRTKTRGSDANSIRSVSSIRTVMSGMSALWTSFGIGSGISASRTERQKAALQADLKYLYSSFTKIPCLKLSPDWRARLIRGYEEFPFDSAVPLYVFKNVQALEVTDIDFRQFFGWDRLADQLRSLTIKRASLDDPADVLIDIVLDDMDKRRRRSSKTQASPTVPWGGAASPRKSPTMPSVELRKSTSAPGSPDVRKSISDLPIGSLNSELDSDQYGDASQDVPRPSHVRAGSLELASPGKESRPRSHSPRRPASSRHGSAHARGSHKVRRSGSGSSHSSLSDSWHQRAHSVHTFTTRILPASKWRFLRHLSLADNSLTAIPANSLSPLSNTLYSLDLSSNLFTQIPDSLANLTALRALNLANCMIDSLHSLKRNPLPAITAINLRNNRLQSLAGIERLVPLERLDLRDNRLTDPTELARLTSLPEIREIYVEGNPFTRTHRDYRITIFNLFRQTPGYTEDITIDMTGPSYLEKKYLVNRVAEPPAVPVIKPEPVELPAVDVSKPTIIYDPAPVSSLYRKERPLPRASASEVNTTSTRRRRTPKRRIVDLATADSPMPYAQPIETRPHERPSPIAIGGNYSLSQTEAPTVGSMGESNSPPPSVDIPRIDANVLPPLSPIYPIHESARAEDPWQRGQEWDAGGELYRRKIEALRNRIGDNYLNVLAEEGWDPASPPTFGSPPFPLAASAPHAPKAQAIHSGRTLG